MMLTKTLEYGLPALFLDYMTSTAVRQPFYSFGIASASFWKIFFDPYHDTIFK